MTDAYYQAADYQASSGVTTSGKRPYRSRCAALRKLTAIDRAKALALHSEAHRLCFIARSVRFPVDIAPEIMGAAAAPPGWSATRNLALDHAANSRQVGRSQWVDATLAQSPLIRVYEADFVRGRQFKQNKALFRF
jgi:hypothetical protein